MGEITINCLRSFKFKKKIIVKDKIMIVTAEKGMLLESTRT